MTVLWNSADKSANITLSGGSLVATTTSATQGAVRGDTSFASGKQYYEATITNITGSLWSVGWANAAMSLAAALGSTTNSVVLQPNQSNGRGFYNNGSLGTLGVPPTTGDTICVAFDITNKLIWFRINNGRWNGSATADPATGTGGWSVSTIGAGPYYPIFGDNGSGGAITARFGALDMWFETPSGFSTLDTNVQSYMATSKMLGYAVEGPPQDAVSASKMLGYAVEGPPQDAVSASKMLGYVITTTQKSSYSRQRHYVYLRR